MINQYGPGLVLFEEGFNHRIVNSPRQTLPKILTRPSNGGFCSRLKEKIPLKTLFSYCRDESLAKEDTAVIGFKAS
jgi:hypothetical protein